MNGVVTDSGTAVMTSLAAALSLFLAAIPRSIGFIVILVIGWLILGVLASAVAALLRAVRFNDLAQRSGLSRFVQNMGVRTDAAGLLANALGDLVRGSTAQAGLSNPDLLANVARIAVWGFGIVVAVNQIGVAQTLVNTLFVGFIGALALAAGLAFGLGGRETAAQIVQDWYRQGRAARPKLERAAENIERNVERNVSSTRGQTRS